MMIAWALAVGFVFGIGVGLAFHDAIVGSNQIR